MENTPTTHAEDLLITFSRREIKTEPISYDNVSQDLPQLDGQMDISSNEACTQPCRNKPGSDLNSVIAKVKANTCIPNRVITLHKIPIFKTKISLNDDIRKRPSNPTPKRLLSSTRKTDQVKERSIKQPKQSKQIKSRLLSTLLKNNEDIIRPLETPLPSIPKNTQVITK